MAEEEIIYPYGANRITEIAQSFSGELINKYKSGGQPSDVARMDAVTYAALNMSMCMLTPFEEPTMYLEEEAEAAEWIDAIKSAREDNWQPLKEILEKRAEMAREASTFLQFQPRQKEADEADAFFNLAKSLIN